LPGRRPFFAVDVGGSAVKSGLVVDGEVEGLAREPVAAELDGLVAQLERLVAGRADWGLSIAGLVDAERGTVRYAANLPLRNTGLADLLTPRPCVLVNDLVAATVGEAGGGTLALLQVGTGIAGRFAREGRVASDQPHAGEIGHLRFRDDGLRCRCGRRGCAEAYGAWGGVLDRLAAAGRPEPAPTELLEQAASDEWAAEVLRDALEAIGFAAAALVAAWDPGTLRVGGGVAAAWGETLLDAVRTGLRDRLLPVLAAGTTVGAARLGDAAPLLGLAALRSGAPVAPRSS
jgi:glucokinase